MIEAQADIIEAAQASAEAGVSDHVRRRAHRRGKPRRYKGRALRLPFIRGEAEKRGNTSVREAEMKLYNNEALAEGQRARPLIKTNEHAAGSRERLLEKIYRNHVESKTEKGLIA